MSRPRLHSTTSLAQLADLVRTSGLRLNPAHKEFDPAGRQVAEGRSPSRSEAAYAPPANEEEDFLRAVDGVQRAAWKHDPCPLSRPPAARDEDPELAARRLMEQAVNADTPIAAPDHPEYIEGWIGVAGKRYLAKLRNGLYSIQGQVDLHGLNRKEARRLVEDYIVRMSRYRSCCIKIIHGRGINSSTDRATLKESLQRFLSTRRMSRYVVAYASAPFRDGGVGAVYVLLRRP